MAKAVLWDLDGTLLLSRLSIRETMNTVLAERGLPQFTAAELDGLIGQPLRAILATKTSDTAAVEAMALRYREAYGEVGWVTVRVAPGLIPLIERLRQDGVRIGIVTSKGQQETELLLADLGLSHLVDAVAGDDDVRPLKPDPAPVRAALSSLGVPPESGVMVGDTTYDVAAARGAGVACVGVLWGMHGRAALRDAGAAATVGDARDLERAIRKILDG